jgi:uncharacterized protein (DUF1330 family)
MEQTYVDPSRENFALFKALPRDEPIHMLNFIRLRDMAAYPQAHTCSGLGWTGSQAYDEYIRLINPLIEGLGGGMVWHQTLECMVTGPETFEWDHVFVMGYPSANAFFAMVKDPFYVSDVLPHRTAAVLDSRLVRYRGV